MYKLVFDVTTNFRDREFTSTLQGIVSEDGIDGWRLMDFGGQARDASWNARRVKPEGLLKKTNRIDSWQFELTEAGKGEIAVDGDAIVFRTTKAGLQNWHVQAYQTGIDLADGKTYELKFTAMSPDGATVLVMGIINQEDWHGIGLQEEVYLGENFRDYTFTFTASDVVPKNNRIGFVLGEDEGTVHLKDMSLIEK